MSSGLKSLLMLRFIIFALIWLVWLRAEAQEASTTVRRVGVMVIAGEELKLMQIGFTVFGNEYGQIPVPDDRLAGVLYEGVKQQLEREGGMHVRRLEIPVAHRLAWAQRMLEPVFFGSAVSRLEKELEPLRQGCDCDAIVVVTESSREVVGTNQIYRGITWHRRAQGSVLVVPLTLILMTPTESRNRGQAFNFASPIPVGSAWVGKADTVRVLESVHWDLLQDAAARSLRGSLQRPLHALGLRHSCSRFIYEFETSPRQRDPSNPDYVPPPPGLDQSDAARCGQFGF